MTPKEKATELINIFCDVDMPSQHSHATMGKEAARDCAIILCETIIHQFNSAPALNALNETKEIQKIWKYWVDVKVETELVKFI